MPDRSQGSSPLGGAEVAGSGPVPHPLGERGGPLRGLWAAPRSPGQAPCRTP